MRKLPIAGLLLAASTTLTAGQNDPIGAPAGVRVWHQDIDGLPGSVAADNEFGHALAVGDFDCDGFDDLAVGVPYHDRVEFDGQSFQVFTDSGAVLLLFGGVAGLGTRNATLLVPPLPAGSEVGFALAAGPAGFFTLDCDDLLIGAPGRHGDKGGVAWLSADPVSRSTVLSVFSSQAAYDDTQDNDTGDRFGEVLAQGALGDASWGAAIGAPGEDIGAVADAGHVVRSSGSGWIGMDQGALGFGTFVEAGDQFGGALAIGDVDADGFGDLVVGVPFEDGSASRSGEADVFFGGIGGLGGGTAAYDGNDMNGHGAFVDGFFGWGLAARSEGLHRLAIGAPGNYKGIVRAGALFVCVNVNDPALCGSNLERDGDDFDMAESYDRLGAAVAFGAFPTAEMHSLATGMRGHSGGAGAVGLMTLQSGSYLLGTSSLLDQAMLGFNNVADDHFGRALAVGNFNGRGADELVVAAPRKAVATGNGTASVAGAIYELSWDAGYTDPLFSDGFE